MSEQLTLIPHQRRRKPRRQPSLMAAVVARKPLAASRRRKPRNLPRRVCGKDAKVCHRPRFLFAGLAVAALLWGAWVTKNILDPAVVKAPIASVRLEQIIGEYVQAQARSNTPPEIVTQQTQAFMAALGEELKARGADGTTVMVGEAVLSQNVPDITADVRNAIYAKVPPPATPAAAPPPRVCARSSNSPMVRPRCRFRDSRAGRGGPPPCRLRRCHSCADRCWRRPFRGAFAVAGCEKADGEPRERDPNATTMRMTGPDGEEVVAEIVETKNGMRMRIEGNGEEQTIEMELPEGFQRPGAGIAPGDGSEQRKRWQESRRGHQDVHP